MALGTPDREDLSKARTDKGEWMLYKTDGH